MCCKVKLLLRHSSFPRSPVLMECFEIWVEQVKLFSIKFDNDTQFCEDLNADHSFAKFVAVALKDILRTDGQQTLFHVNWAITTNC